MIRIYSIQQALSLRGQIPELAIIRAIQFMGDGYSPEEHGHVIVIQEGDDLTHIKEVGEDGLFTDGVPNFEYIEAFVDGDSHVLEIVLALDSERTVALIVEQDCLDADLVSSLLKHSSPPQSLPSLERTMP